MVYIQDDKIAFNWIQQNTSDEDLFIISVIENIQKHGTNMEPMRVFWIYPLTNRHTNKVIFNTTWKEGIINNCNSEKSDIYIYTGGHQYSFSKEILSKINWIKSVFEQGEIKIFKVIKCAKSNT